MARMSFNNDPVIQMMEQKQGRQTENFNMKTSDSEFDSDDKPLPPGLIPVAENGVVLQT